MLNITLQLYIRQVIIMPIDVEYTDEFEVWWDTLSEPEQDDVAATVGLLAD